MKSKGGGTHQQHLPDLRTIPWPRRLCGANISSAVVVMLAATALLTGCSGAQTIAIDRGTFGLMYADTAHVIRSACERRKLSDVECAKLDAVDKKVREAIMSPEKAIDWAEVMEMLGGVAKLAAKAAI